MWKKLYLCMKWSLWIKLTMAPKLKGTQLSNIWLRMLFMRKICWSYSKSLSIFCTDIPYTHARFLHTRIFIFMLYVWLDDDHPVSRDAVLETSNCTDTQILGSDFCQTLDQLGETYKSSSNMTSFEKQFQLMMTSLNNGLCIIIVIC